nr:hypothetical protein [uncultured Rhodopila sp.]
MLLFGRGLGRFEISTQVRTWLGHWKMTFEEVDAALPEPTEHLDPDLPAGEIEAAPATLEGRETMFRQ